MASLSFLNMIFRAGAELVQARAQMRPRPDRSGGLAVNMNRYLSLRHCRDEYIDMGLYLNLCGHGLCGLGGLCPERSVCQTSTNQIRVKWQMKTARILVQKGGGRFVEFPVLYFVRSSRRPRLAQVR